MHMTVTRTRTLEHCVGSRIPGDSTIGPDRDAASAGARWGSVTSGIGGDGGANHRPTFWTSTYEPGRG